MLIIAPSLKSDGLFFRGHLADGVEVICHVHTTCFNPQISNPPLYNHRAVEAQPHSLEWVMFGSGTTINCNRGYHFRPGCKAPWLWHVFNQAGWGGKAPRCKCKQVLPYIFFMGLLLSQVSFKQHTVEPMGRFSISRFSLHIFFSDLRTTGRHMRS